MITVKDIAKHCKVSPGTVSNILNGRENVGERTRQRVLEYVKKTGYKRNYFAQSIRSRGTGHKLMSIITEGLGVFGSSTIVESIMATCDAADYRTMLMNLGLYEKYSDSWFDDNGILQDTVKAAISESQAVRVSGIIYVAGHHRVVDCFPPDFPIPTVIAYALSKDSKHPSIVIDDERAGYDTGKYLVAKGHENIGIVAGKAGNHHTESRLKGFDRAMKECDVAYDKSLIFNGDWGRRSGQQGAAYLVGKNVSAIFCLNDEMAAGVYDYMFEKNLTVGKDISVVGFDNMQLSNYIRPHLTTNEIQLREIGKKAAEVMMGLLEGKDTPEGPAPTFKIPCKLIERESVVKLLGVR